MANLVQLLLLFQPRDTKIELFMQNNIIYYTNNYEHALA
jgi:hypothetical protein